MAQDEREPANHDDGRRGGHERARVDGRKVRGEGGVSADAAFRVKLTLEELIANIATHGRADDHEPTIDIEIEVQPGKIVMVTTDDGRQFDPQRHPRRQQADRLEDMSIGGLGLEFVKRCASRIQYCLAGHWNRIRIEQDITS